MIGSDEIEEFDTPPLRVTRSSSPAPTRGVAIAMHANKAKDRARHMARSLMRWLSLSHQIRFSAFRKLA
jgi:hypothetical protein